MAETTIREVVLKGVNASSKIASTFFLDKELLSVYYLHWNHRVHAFRHASILAGVFAFLMPRRSS